MSMVRVQVHTQPGPQRLRKVELVLSAGKDLNTAAAKMQGVSQ